MRVGKILAAVVLVLLVCALSAIMWLRSSETLAEEGPPVMAVESPLPSPTPHVSAPPITTPEEEKEDETQTAGKPEVDITSWELRLVNVENPLSPDFAPELTALEGGQQFDSRAASALEAFAAAAREENLSVYITSSYRGYAIQKSLFENKVNQYISSTGSYDAAVAKARTIVAYPGTSEHQLGLAADIVDKYYEYMNESLAGTALSIWMKENCADYGFILRYPQDKQDITGVMFEPWHFRYVGVEAAAYIMENGLCLEEFAELYK